MRAAAGLALAGVLALFLAASAFTAVVLPYSRWDALYFGAWSRLIAQGSFHAASVGPEQLQRPLFYVAQGLLWKGLGFHEVLGRLLSLGFSILLAVALYALARRLGRSRVEALVAVLALTLVPAFALDVAGGITDIPAAALVAATAAALWLGSRGRGRAAAVCLLAAAAVLAKPSSLFALAGLAAADALGPRPSLRARLGLGVAPIGAGAAAALVYDAVEAQQRHLSLVSFLSAGTGGYYARLAASMRGDVLLRGDWLGPDLRLLLAFGLVYALLHAAGAGGRRAALGAFVVSGLATWFLPSLVTGGPPFGAGPFAGGLGAHDVVYLVLLALLPLSVLAAEADGPGRLWSGRLLVWALPPLVVWADRAAYADRLASPAWPALILLATTPVVLVLRGAARFRPGIAPLALAPLLLAGVLAVPTVDGLGAARWRVLRDAGLAGWRDGPRMNHFALGAFADELASVRAHLGSGDRVVSSDGKLRFFYPHRIIDATASTCDQLAGSRVFVFLLDPDSMAQNGGRSLAGWLACSDPHTHLVAERPGAFATFVVGAPPGIVAVLGQGLGRAAAVRLRRRAVKVGFRNALVERRGARAYDVVVPGYVRMSQEAGVQAEAATVGLHVHFEMRK